MPRAYAAGQCHTADPSHLRLSAGCRLSCKCWTAGTQSQHVLGWISTLVISAHVPGHCPVDLSVQRVGEDQAYSQAASVLIQAVLGPHMQRICRAVELLLFTGGTQPSDQRHHLRSSSCRGGGADQMPRPQHASACFCMHANHGGHRVRLAPVLDPGWPGRCQA